MAEAGTVLAQLNFWRVLDEYNYAVRKPAVPGKCDKNFVANLPYPKAKNIS